MCQRVKPLNLGSLTFLCDLHARCIATSTHLVSATCVRHCCARSTPTCVVIAKQYVSPTRVRLGMCLLQHTGVAAAGLSCDKLSGSPGSAEHRCVQHMLSSASEGLRVRNSHHRLAQPSRIAFQWYSSAPGMPAGSQLLKRGRPGLQRQRIKHVVWQTRVATARTWRIRMLSIQAFMLGSPGRGGLALHRPAVVGALLSQVNNGA